MKEFYGERIELSVLIASDAFATFRSGGDSRLVVTWTTSPSREAQRGKTGSFTQIDTEAVSDAKVRADAASFVLDHEQV